jgi:putative ABC transport system permease protein
VTVASGPSPAGSTPALLDRPSAGGDGNGAGQGRGWERSGGVAARRAVVRWAWRLFRREWRQQLLVLVLLTLAVAVASGGTAALYSTAPIDDGALGHAQQRIDLGGRAPTESGAGAATPSVAETLASAEATFGTVEAIGVSTVAVPGSVTRVELRAQDPDGPYGAPMLAILAGRYPRAADELAVTEDVADLLDVTIGDTVELGDARWTVVGHVENPADLGDRFALVTPSRIDQAERISLLVDADQEQIDAFISGIPGGVAVGDRGEDTATTAAVVTLGMSTVVLLLVCLIAAAGFVVVAQRRLRQLGMLAAIGATEKHVRLVMVANGVAVGVVAAVVGTALGLGSWIVLAGHVEEAIGHRVDPGDLPWWLVAAGMVLAVLTATAAAWWPARTVARIPVVQALSARPPRPHPAHRSLLLAVVLVVGGFAGLATGIDTSDGSARPLLVVGGVLATVLGMLLLSPAAVSLLPVIARRLPLSPRLALRDLGRNQARSGAAVAAISLGLGIAVTVVVIASAADASSRQDAGPGNLADDQLVLSIGNPRHVVPERTPAEVELMDSRVDELAGALGDASVVPLDSAIDPSASLAPVPAGSEDTGGRPSAALARQTGPRFYEGSPVDVATPELLAWAGIDPDDIDPGVEAVTSLTDELVWIPELADQKGEAPEPEPAVLQHVDLPDHRSLPRVLVTPEALERRGLEAARSGWLVQTDRPLTSDQIDQAREAATSAGLFLEVREAPQSTAAVRSIATAIGVLVALGILAMTVGLVRSEAAADMRTLTATGAGGAVRRAITASTAAALGFLGALLGIAGAYAALIAGYLDEPWSLGHVPFVHLAAIAAGLPLVAAAAGWLLAGREPPALARPPIE